MADIFDEVQEELRAERAKRLLNRYGGLLAGAALVVVLGAAGVEGWRWWQHRAATAASEGFLAAARAAEAPNADASAVAGRFAAVADTAPPGYRVLARLRAAGLRADAGDRDGALAAWDAVARDGAADPPFRDLASLLWGMHALDTGDAAEVEARMAPLAEGNGPFRASAAEIRALAILKRGDLDAARQRFAALAKDAAAPEGVRDRAGRVLSGLGGG